MIKKKLEKAIECYQKKAEIWVHIKNLKTPLNGFMKLNIFPQKNQTNIIVLLLK